MTQFAIAFHLSFFSIDEGNFDNPSCSCLSCSSLQSADVEFDDYFSLADLEPDLDLEVALVDAVGRVFEAALFAQSSIYWKQYLVHEHRKV